MSKALIPASGNGIEPRPVKLPGFEFIGTVKSSPSRP